LRANQFHSKLGRGVSRVSWTSSIEKARNPQTLAQMGFAELLWSYRGWIAYVLLMGLAIPARSKVVAAAALGGILLLYSLAPFIF